jgi:RNA polymerase sigma-70 factor (ECF subfamily)
VRQIAALPARDAAASGLILAMDGKRNEEGATAGSAPPEGGLCATMLANRTALLRYLTARRMPVDEAEDMLQDLFVRIETVVKGPVSEPRAYLYRMLDNLLLNRRRAAGRRTDRERAWAATQLGPLVAADQRPSAEESLIARQRLAAVANALSELPERTQLILRRYRVDGVAQKDIAAELGISVSAVEKHLQKAYVAVVKAREGLDADEGAGRS